MVQSFNCSDFLDSFMNKKAQNAGVLCYGNQNRDLDLASVSCLCVAHLYW